MIDLIAGLIMIIASGLNYFGYFKYAIWVYFFLDSLWLLQSILSKHIYSSILLFIALIFTLGVMIKVNKGLFVSKLKK